MSTQALLVFCTCPDRSVGLQIAETLVDRRLAACVNLLPRITSVYAWEGRRETAEEIQLLIKTRVESYAALERTLLELHPYELPEIVAVPIEKGLTAYVEWVTTCTTEQA
jgi:periplasmic divalent cation tolerance protein